MSEVDGLELRVIEPDAWWSREGLLDAEKVAIEPDQGCVYWLFDHQSLLYVGSTRHPHRRLTQHAAQKPWWREVWRIEQLVTPTPGLALHLEDEAITAQRPLYNRTGPWAQERKRVQRRGLDDVMTELVSCLGLPG